jgi:hypothetical protein
MALGRVGLDLDLVPCLAQGHQLDYRQQLTTLTALQKVTQWVSKRGNIGQSLRARGLLLPITAFFLSQQLSWTIILVQ